VVREDLAAKFAEDSGTANTGIDEVGKPARLGFGDESGLSC
jgi:hypothetical protein